MFFFFFFFLRGTKKGILSRSAAWRWRARGGGRRAKMAAQIRAAVTPALANKVQTAHSCSVLVESSCGVVWAQRGCGSCVWNRGGPLVTWAICEPQERWGDAPRECEVDFIIPYPIPLPLVVSATAAPPQKPLEPGAEMCLCLELWISLGWI